MKTILTLVGGGKTDDAVLDAAITLARPFQSHLECLHIRVDPAQALFWTPHADYATGRALQEALGNAQTMADERAATARKHFEAMCGRERITVAGTRTGFSGMTAEWIEETGGTIDRIVQRARYHDLVVAARPSAPNGLPRYLIELLLMQSGRPVLIAPAGATRPPSGSVIVFWKSTCEAARAVAAAIPILKKAERVVLAGVGEAPGQSREAIEAVAKFLSWHGIDAATEWMDNAPNGAAQAMEDLATWHDAGLIVMGGYGHSRTREMIFGGCTRNFLENAERPVLLMH